MYLLPVDMTSQQPTKLAKHLKNQAGLKVRSNVSKQVFELNFRHPDQANTKFRQKLRKDQNSQIGLNRQLILLR